MGKAFDLEERLLGYAGGIVELTNALPNSRAGAHVANQLLRSGTSPLSNHGEAEAAESMLDFIHKLRVCLKELRESRRWLRLIGKIPLIKEGDSIKDLLVETEELIRIFVASIKTAQKNSHSKNPST